MIDRKPSRPGRGAAEVVSQAQRDTHLNNPAPEPQGHGETRTVPLCPSDDALACAFAERFAGHLRYVEQSTARVHDRWLIRNGDDWIPDKTLYVLDLVRELCREAAALIDDPVLAREITSATTISAVERLARCDRRLAATREQGRKGKEKQ